MRTVFLNKSGHRWRNFSYCGFSEKAHVFFPESGKTKRYAIRYWEAIGNFAVPFVRIKGKLEQLTEWDHWQISNEKPRVWVINSEENRDLKWGRK